jgi:putative hydrolase of the HAD superfamily
MDEAAIEHVRSLGAAITVRDGMELMPGVEESLHQLSTHNRLFVLTKGDDAEQRAKLRRSRLGEYFEDVEVAREKNVQTYNHVLERWRLDPVMTWMIGNSPRSDINPALSAGLNAVLIPHAQTWEMEIEDIEQRHGNRLTVVESVSDLLSLFVPPT